MGASYLLLVRISPLTTPYLLHICPLYYGHLPPPPPSLSFCLSVCLSVSLPGEARLLSICPFAPLLFVFLYRGTFAYQFFFYLSLYLSLPTIVSLKHTHTFSLFFFSRALSLPPLSFAL
jgi:hypothetical protein